VGDAETLCSRLIGASYDYAPLEGAIKPATRALQELSRLHRLSRSKHPPRVSAGDARADENRPTLDPGRQRPSTMTTLHRDPLFDRHHQTLSGDPSRWAPRPSAPSGVRPSAARSRPRCTTWTSGDSSIRPSLADGPRAVTVSSLGAGGTSYVLLRGRGVDSYDDGGAGHGRLRSARPPSRPDALRELPPTPTLTRAYDAAAQASDGRRPSPT
jgi:hypothetical protein